jgi:uncharacterized protein YraI
VTLRPFVGAALVLTGLAMLTSAASASQAVTLDKVSLLAAPLGSSSLMGSLAKGTTVGVVWCGPEVKFCLVKFHGKTGWVLATDLAGVGTAAAAGMAGKVDKTAQGAPGAPASDPKKAVEAPIKQVAPPKQNNSGPTYTQVTPPYKLINP